MPRCVRPGCNKDYNEGDDEPCKYHPGNAVFHEGLKSWSCCNEINKPVLDFESFMKIEGCTEAISHSTLKPDPPSRPVELTSSSHDAKKLKLATSTDGVEVYASGPSVKPVSVQVAPVAPIPIVEDEDDIEVQVPIGMQCKRGGCKKVFISQEASRTGDGPDAICIYHPSPPIFREGSKGYLCCKRRVLEFEEFLKIPGCKEGRHVFASKNKPVLSEEPTVSCRIDHYQTPKEVIVSVFAKRADKQTSKIEFQESQLILDIALPMAQRFQKTVHLFGPIDPTTSSYQIMGTKVEIKLMKQDGRSWGSLESNTPSLSLTFGVGGRTGTIGAKEIIV